MWDNRESKRNPKAPNFKCKDKGCNGVIWPPREPSNIPVTIAAEEGPEEVEPIVAEPVDSSCPKCGGETWDNRLSKKNPKAPDFKCKNRSCDGVIWPPRV
jgi:hypothetical protein